MSIKVVFASVLKSIYDVRMYHKLAKAMPSVAEVHLIGSPSKSANNSEENPNYFFHPIANFHRLSWYRLFFGFRFLFLLFNIQPNVLIINTFELLPFAIFYKYIRKLFHFFLAFFAPLSYPIPCSCLVYDVSENYYQNIAYQTTYPVGLRSVLAIGVRFFENVSKFFIDGFLLAEQCYAKELDFVQKNYLLLPNLFKPLAVKNEIDYGIKSVITNNYLKLVHTGTLSVSYGTLEGIEFAKKLHQAGVPVHLTIAGFCSDTTYYQQLQQAIQGFEFLFTCYISTQSPLPYSKIVACFKGATAALLPYQVNKSNQNRIPTKFYEYLYYNLPLLIPPNIAWQQFCKVYQGALVVDFTALTIDNIVQQFYEPYCQRKFYTIAFDKNELLWGETEETKLWEFLLKLTPQEF